MDQGRRIFLLGGSATLVTACTPELFTTSCFGDSVTGIDNTISDIADDYVITIPSRCLEPDNETVQRDGVTIHTPPYYHDAIQRHLVFFRRFSGEEQVKNIDRVVMAPVQEECIYGAGTIRIPSWKENSKYGNGTISPPYESLIFSNLESGLSSYAAKDFASLLQLKTSCRAAMFEEWQERDLLHRSSGFDRNVLTEDDFDEFISYLYSDYAQYALHIGRNLPEHPLLQEYFLPALDLEEMNLTDVWAQVNTPFTPFLEDHTEVSDEQVQSLIEYGYITPEYEDILKVVNLLPKLKNLYKRYQATAHEALRTWEAEHS